jgi:predicted metal-dependent hydrolase
MRGPRRLFLQALIHFAVAFYHQQRRNPLGAERQLRKGLRKLERYLPVYEGVDTATLDREGHDCLRRIMAGEMPEPPRMLLQGLLDS